MRWKNQAYAISEMGADHIRKELPCQDYSLVKKEKKWTLAVVSDGHGGKDYVRSDRGSRLACESVLQVIQQNPPGRREFDKTYAAAITEQIIECWRERLVQDLVKQSLTEEELARVKPETREQYERGEYLEKAYGCTLAYVLVTDMGMLVAQLGDSECYIKSSEGIYSKPLPEDEDCQFNMTSSLCGYNALEKFRYEIMKEVPQGIFLMSDGIVNSFENESYLTSFLDVVYEAYSDEEESASEELRTFLGRLSKQGSGDDVSLACVFCEKKTIFEYLPFLKKWMKGEE